MILLIDWILVYETNTFFGYLIRYFAWIIYVLEDVG